jgi:hypothetical protein
MAGYRVLARATLGYCLSLKSERSMVRSMPLDQAAETDAACIAALLRDTIAADRFPLSPRVRRWKAILDKLEPPPPKREPLPPPLPPLKLAGEPSMVVARMRNPKRRRRFN